MKKTGLIIIIVICFVVFIACSTAGVLLTIRTIGWSNLTDQTAWQNQIGTWLQDNPIWDHVNNLGNQLSIDETRDLDLEGINTVEITAVSEQVRLLTAGDRAYAQLKGSYHSFSQSIAWITEKQDGILKIHTRYPRFGLLSGDLAFIVQIPASYTGNVRVNAVSGSCVLPDDMACQWNTFRFSGVSGELTLARADMDNLNFSSVSGNIVINKADCKINGQTTSSEININYNVFQACKLNTISGDINLDLPQNTNCELEYTTISGDFTQNGLTFSDTKDNKRKVSGTLGQGGTSLDVSTTSGNLSMSGH
ncbi:MAG: DUF4097 family beta strand repeat-containing protein [Clostridiaceae bacterium]|nr:DUF4097 family beta strand repeat-containing protein [Clostridiaceae bacterium]